MGQLTRPSQNELYLSQSFPDDKDNNVEHTYSKQNTLLELYYNMAHKSDTHLSKYKSI